MARFAWLALVAATAAAAAACAGPVRPAITGNRNDAATRYTMQPVMLRGGEGPHSASHSSTVVAGTLELAGGRAALRLELQTARSYIRCPKEWRDGTVSTMQACAPDDAKDSTTNSRIGLAGEARWEAGTLSARLRDGGRTIGLRCDRTSTGLQCAIEGDSTLFEGPGERPERLVFELGADGGPARAAG
jgi:hypothetical protein